MSTVVQLECLEDRLEEAGDQPDLPSLRVEIVGKGEEASTIYSNQLSLLVHQLPRPARGQPKKGQQVCLLPSLSHRCGRGHLTLRHSQASVSAG